MTSSTHRGSAAPANHRSGSGASRSTQSRPGSNGGGNGRPRRRSGGSGGGRGPSQRPAAARRSVLDDLPVSVVPTENLPSFAELGLPAPIVTLLGRNGLASPFPIQAATIPDALSGRDLLGRAATGAGKTLAFGLPLIARLSTGHAAPRRPRGLVLVPTRELAMQVTDGLTPYASACGLTVRLVAGGLSIGKQEQSLARGVDILVATPGRLEDLISRRSCNLGDVEIVVLDEADHMADLGFLPVVKRLLDQTEPGGQRMLFSATLDGDVAILVQNYLVDPAAHALSTSVASVDTMTHHVLRVDHDAKFDLVASMASREGRTLGFVRTKHGADRLARKLSQVGVAAGVLHGGRSQPQRNKALDAFKDGSVPVLIATDVAARGIHVDDISLVIHVDPPADPKDYLHRSGRTARAGGSGVVVLLSTPDEKRDVDAMLAAAGVRPLVRDAAGSQEHIASVTGARTPSGVAIPVERPRQSRPNPRADGSAPHPRAGGRPNQGGAQRRRGGAGGAGSSRSAGGSHSSGGSRSSGGAAAFSASRRSR